MRITKRPSKTRQEFEEPMKAKEDFKLDDLLTPDLVRCKKTLKERDEVIEQVGKLMFEANKIEERYIGAMKQVIEELGAYMVIAPGIALLHARPEDGVLEPCLALITLSDPVIFGHPENDPVDIVFGLAAKDNQSHIKALTTLAKRLATLGVIENLRRANSKEELLKEICA